MSTIVENNIDRVNAFLEKHAKDNLYWQPMTIQYAELISNERNTELLEMNNELFEALKEICVFQKKYYGNATDTHVELIALSNKYEQLIQKHTKK